MTDADNIDTCSLHGTGAKNVTLAQNRGVRGDRKKQLELLCKRAGCRLVDLYISFITNENVMMIEGSLEQITRIKAVLRLSGAYSSISVYILHSATEIADDRAAVINLESVWQPPDQDEIDRMLLDE